MNRALGLQPPIPMNEKRIALRLPSLCPVHSLRAKCGQPERALTRSRPLPIALLHRYLLAASRYIQKAKVSVAMIVSTGARVDYCFMSGPLLDFPNLDWPRKRQNLPAGSHTEEFNADAARIRAADRASFGTNLRDWFGGSRSLPGREEIVGLGSYGKTLTILTTDLFADDEDEEADLEESWTPRFRR